MEAPDMSGEAAPGVQEVGEGGPAMQGHAEGAPLMGTDMPVQLDLSQLPVEALLSALKSKPPEELLEGAGKLSAISAKVGYKQVSMHHEHAKLDSPKPRIKPEVRTACVQCRRTHFKCDSNKPCGRCVSRGWSQECSFDADEDSLQSLPPKSPVPRLRKKPPVQKQGYSTSGDKLCEHGLEKRYCLNPTCVNQGGGKAMCKHGRRKRSCPDPECVAEMEERRRQIQGGRCKHGVQMRCCTQDECRIDFQLAGHQYREKLKERKRVASSEPGDSSDKPSKVKRASRPGPLKPTHLPPWPTPHNRVAGAEGEGAEMHDGTDGTEKTAAAAAVMALSGQDTCSTVGGVTALANVNFMYPIHGLLTDKPRQMLPQKGVEVGVTGVPCGLYQIHRILTEEQAQALAKEAAPTSDDVRQPDVHGGDVGEHAAPEVPVSHDSAGLDGETDAAHTHEHVEVVDAAHAAPPLEGEHVGEDHPAEHHHQAGDGADGAVAAADHPVPPPEGEQEHMDHHG